jgi:hypothetical protein
MSFHLRKENAVIQSEPIVDRNCGPAAAAMPSVEVIQQQDGGAAQSAYVHAELSDAP